MAGYRISDPAKADIVSLLRISETLHGAAARRSYRALITAAMRRVAAHPVGLSTIDRAEFLPGLRSFHIRHSREASSEARVAHPVHVIFYRAAGSGQIEIVRVLHERMDPQRHIDENS